MVWLFSTRLYSGIKKSQQGSVWTYWIRSEKGEGQKISWQVNGYRLLGLSRSTLNSLCLKSVNVISVYYRKVLRKLKADICRKWSDLRDDCPYSSEFTEFSTSSVDSFFRIRLIHLIWHPKIFDHSSASKISWVASILQMIYRRSKWLQNSSVTV